VRFSNPSFASFPSFRSALLFSCALHALFLMGYLTRDLDTQAVVVETLRSLEVVLEPPAEVTPGAVAEVLPERIPERIPETSLELPAQALVDADQPALKEADPKPAPSKALNLNRPSEWDAIVLDEPKTSEGGVFKSSTRTAITKRRERQDAARALSRAQVARLGLPAGSYRRETDDGEDVKTVKGCFTKRLEQGPTGGQIRWWRTRCVDSKKPAWKREVLSFGPDHKVDPNPADSKSDCPNGRCWAY